MVDHDKKLPVCIDGIWVSGEIFDTAFACHLKKCKGACCVEGDMGAPLEGNELHVLHKIFPIIESHLSDRGRTVIAKQGLYVRDQEHEISTPTVEGKECVYAKRHHDGHWICAIEEAYEAGKIDFKKPISCHLYPIRITKKTNFEAVNYNQWDVCQSACIYGKRKKKFLYQFLKEALIRKYGAPWYGKLESVEKEISLLKRG